MRWVAGEPREKDDGFAVGESQCAVRRDGAFSTDPWFQSFPAAGGDSGR